MTYDALMRWEWEGGTPASVSDRGEGVRAEARGEHPQSAAPQGVSAERRVVVASPLRSEGWQVDGSER